ncbi:uncharacterized protein LOC128468785 [Spea bombifrons]|uniref:uncharacterized protein LOC128468785 n=1 Tax=Spea bombifrons TaxID=233779 RepID=UPI00234A7960|nr:uncharacterized protein LOC128468785 [Spea bombifrons]
MSVSTARLGDLCVTTTVLPASDAGALRRDASHTWTPEITMKFKTLHMKALSVLLILIGVLQISFGVIMALAEDEYQSLTVRSGVYIWGGLVVFVAGCITVASETKENINMIKACLVSHVTNVAVGGVAMIVYMVQLYAETQTCWARTDRHDLNNCVSMDNEEVTTVSHHYYDYVEHNDVTTLRVTVNSMILLFSLLGWIISLCVVFSGWKVLKDVGYSLLN